MSPYAMVLSLVTIIRRVQSAPMCSCTHSNCREKASWGSPTTLYWQHCRRRSRPTTILFFRRARLVSTHENWLSSPPPTYLF